MNNRQQVVRGVLISLFFGLVAFVLIPLYVRRPTFIPGFAPPPDMWPKAVSVLGVGLGVLAVFFAKADTAQDSRHWSHGGLLRVGLTLLLFAAFVVLIPVSGFLFASCGFFFGSFLLTGAARHWKVAAFLAVTLPLALYFFFSFVTHTLFPQGKWPLALTLW